MFIYMDVNYHTLQHWVFLRLQVCRCDKKKIIKKKRLYDLVNLCLCYFLSCETGQFKHHRASHWACPTKPMKLILKFLKLILEFYQTHRLLKYPTEQDDVRNFPIKAILEDCCLSGIIFKHLHVAEGPFVFITV